MKIAIFGTGGIGAIFGSRLLEAGETVHFIARGAHLEALRTRGLEVTRPGGATLYDGLSATDDPAAIGPVDFVLLGVKLWDLEAAAKACVPLLGPDTAVIGVQNGIDAYPVIAGAVGAAHAIAGVAEVSATITGPGTVAQTGDFNRLRLGEEDGRKSPRLEAFEAACRRAGIDFFLSENIEADRWRKFVMLASLSGLTALTREPIGPILADADMRRTFVASLEEIVAVGLARGVALDADQASHTLSFAEKLPPSMRASMALDLAAGRRLELDWLSGRVSKLGKELSVPTPVSDTIYTALKPFALGR